MRPRSRSHWTIAALAAGVATSCALLLDYSALQKGGTDAGSSAGTSAGGASGAAGASTTGGTAGAAGSSPCGVCDDGNACTVDYCDTSSGTPTCKANGMKLDGFEQRVTADKVHRVTIATGTNSFYLSAYTTTATGAEVTLYRVGTKTTDTALETIAQLSRVGTLAGRPASAAGIAVDTRSGLTLHTYVALRETLRAQVHHLVFDGTYKMVADEPLPSSLPVGSPGYDDSVPARFPYTWQLGNTIDSTWINSDGAISLAQTTTTGTTLSSMGSTDTTMKASGVLGIGTKSDVPVVVWTGPTSGLWTQVLGQPPQTATECVPGIGAFLPGFDGTSAHLAGFWFTSWTKVTTATLATESRLALCDETATPACKLDTTCKTGDAVQAGTRNSASDSMTRQGDTPGAFIIGVASPVIDAKKSQTSLLLYAARFDFGPVPFQSAVQTQVIGYAQPSTMTSSAPNWLGPDLPAIALAPPDKLLVAWIEPTATQQKLVIQRYQLCLP